VVRRNKMRRRFFIILLRGYALCNKYYLF